LLFGGRTLKTFERAGLTASFLKFTAGAPMIAAAQSKSIDVAMVGTVPFLAGISQGVDWVFVGLDNEYPRAEGFVARRDSGVKTLAELKGKTIAFYRGSPRTVPGRRARAWRLAGCCAPRRSPPIRARAGRAPG
jgi:ABC-type nitrate/sulfonate/bicarbonate transport system substrate-binding protein